MGLCWMWCAGSGRPGAAAGGLNGSVLPDFHGAAKFGSSLSHYLELSCSQRAGYALSEIYDA